MVRDRGETIRLWIFLAAFIQLVVAHYCAARGWRRAFEAMIACTLLQTCITISTRCFVGFGTPSG